MACPKKIVPKNIGYPTEVLIALGPFRRSRICGLRFTPLHDAHTKLKPRPRPAAKGSRYVAMVEAKATTTISETEGKAKAGDIATHQVVLRYFYLAYLLGKLTFGAPSSHLQVEV